MNRSLSIATASLALMMAAAAGAEPKDDAEQPARVLAEQVCAICHGSGGRSTSPETPSLAAQTRPYLVAKIERLRERSAARTDQHVELLGLSLLDDSMVAALARYFSDQAPPPSLAGDPAVVAAGEKIYTRGLAEQKLAPCGVCHGVDGRGLWIFPRLAGQHAAYVERQIGLIQEHLRNAPVMHGIIKTMTPDEIKAVAAFVQSK